MGLEINKGSMFLCVFTESFIMTWTLTKRNMGISEEFLPEDYHNWIYIF